MHDASPTPVAPHAAETGRPAEAWLERWIGLDSQSVGSSAIARAVRLRMEACGEDDEQAFLDRLDRDAEERGRFIDEVVVPESWFFRDQQVFDHLRQCVAEFVRSQRPAPFRVLCVPCAAGEEPYSVAMTFLESGLVADHFRIDAIDVSHAALKRAAAATYSANAFRADDMAFRDRWFRTRDASAELVEDVRRQVHFSWGNLLDEAFATGREPYDIIFCRNLLIYLTPEARRRAEQTLDRLLAAEGVLMLGAAEPPILVGSWRPVASTAVFALRRGTEPAWQPPTMPASPRAAPVNVESRAAVTPSPTLSPSRSPADEAVGWLPSSVDDLLREAGSLANAGRDAEALALCQRHHKTIAPCPRVFFLMGMLHQAAGDLLQAEACLRKTLYLDADHDEALLALALIASRRGDGPLAEQYRQSAARALARKGSS